MIEYVSDTGEDFTEDSSDYYSDGPISRHHLLRHKLILDEGTSSNKDAPKSKDGKRERKRGARKENQSCKNNLDSDQMEQEMSISSNLFSVKPSVKVRPTAMSWMKMLGWVRSWASRVTRLVKTSSKSMFISTSTDKNQRSIQLNLYRVNAQIVKTWK